MILQYIVITGWRNLTITKMATEIIPLHPPKLQILRCIVDFSVTKHLKYYTMLSDASEYSTASKRV